MARYGGKASEKVGRALHERKQGTLRSGGSGRKVISRKQAIAIGLSEAREAGAKVPAAPSARKSSGGKSGARKSSGTKKRSGTKRATAGPRKSSVRKKSSAAGAKKSRR